MRSDEESEINGQGPAISEADIKTLYENWIGFQMEMFWLWREVSRM